MASTHVHVRSLPSNARLSAGGGDNVHVVEKRWDIQLYGPPNKALAGILTSREVGSIVGDYTMRVAQTYQTMLEARTNRNDNRPSKLAKGHLIDTITAYINPMDGYKSDRWVGYVQVGSAELPYGSADEFGRNQYAQYWGSADLTTALRMHLQHKP